ncbi:polysaccharide biosynthesis/export family protein [Desulfosarcina ovata]|uniref:Uncharacterized protein n=1 Tax=Desulfosarcina ovata subsp. ovata TaxID=2752305 RepID=A0A5K8A5H5_9BACT|nr:polysaccharide biosynthesis/export family protein [Desulfosarcina ovata]BBO87706.1 hypothetical protein DSCOOX_08860 [Desulfosarcina ovata subsp. ovata]
MNRRIRMICRHPEVVPGVGNTIRTNKKWGTAILGLLILIVTALGAAGCGGPSGYGKGVTNLSVASPSAIPAAYLIGAGDELEVLYYIDPDVDLPEYRVDSEDTLRVDFYYYPVMSKTLSVRPDGYITLPPIGDVKARNKKPTDLAREISELYTPILAKPVVTVEVIAFNTKIEELKRAIYNQERGMSRLAVVRPDGVISLPYIGDVKAAGLTTHQLQEQLHRRYAHILYNLSTTVVVLNARSNRIYVLGEVERPDFYELLGPTTLTQLLATAGGLTREAKTDQVIIVRRGKNGQPDAHIVYMNQIIGEASLLDPMLQQYDVIYVPRSAMARAALTADFLWRIVPLRFTVDYNLN